MVLEEKNGFLEGETKELKSMVGNMRTELDRVNAELRKNENFKGQIPNQSDTILPHADETFNQNKRPAWLLPLQLMRYILHKCYFTDIDGVNNLKNLYSILNIK